jgi:hypothetical protein
MLSAHFDHRSIGVGPGITMMRMLVALLVFAIALSPGAPRAAPTTYTGEASVTSQSEAERDVGFRTALGNVVADIVGDRGVLERADVADALGEARSYMLQYRYLRAAPDAETGAPGLRLVVEFDSVAVDSMLDRLGLASGTADGAGWIGDPQEATVWISGIHSASDYARVMGILDRNNFVDAARPVEVRDDGLAVRLSLAGDLAHFIAALEAGRDLRVINAEPPLAGIDATLSLDAF